MAKVYRTANGGKVDLGALILSNENTRAAGNMGVNARGDRLIQTMRSLRHATNRYRGHMTWL